MDPALANLANAAYGDIASSAVDRENPRDISGAVDETCVQSLIDDWVYVTPEGNRLVAQGSWRS